MFFLQHTNDVIDLLSHIDNLEAILISLGYLPKKFLKIKLDIVVSNKIVKLCKVESIVSEYTQRLVRRLHLHFRLWNRASFYRRELKSFVACFISMTNYIRSFLFCFGLCTSVKQTYIRMAMTENTKLMVKRFFDKTIFLPLF